MSVNIVKRHLLALPLKSTYVLISERMRNEIFNTIRDNGGVKKISKITRIHEDYFYRFKMGKRCSLFFIFKLYNSLNLDLEELEQNVIQIVSSKSNSIGIDNPKIPFDFDNESGGALLGAIMGDGSVTKLGGIIYNNKNEGLVKFVINSSKNIFGGVHFRTYRKKDGTLQLYLPKIIGDIIMRYGIERSYKVISDSYVNLSKFSDKMKIQFIKQFFDDEGNVRRSDRRLQAKQTRELKENDKNKIREKIEKYAPRMLLQIQRALRKFNIVSKISLEQLRTDNKIKGDFALNIYGKENLENFQKTIGFKLDYKGKLLNEVINSYKFPSAPRNGKILFALEKAKEVEKSYGFITKTLLAKESRRSLKTATYFLIDLKKKGYVNVINRPRNRKGNPLPHVYKICKK